MERLELLSKIGEICTTKHITISTAESCTGGMVAEHLTSVSGASSWFIGGIVSYATRIKEDILHVDKSVIEEKTAVSAETACQMARNVSKIMNTSIAISITGYAGPSAGEDGTPQGTVYIGVSSTLGVYAHHFIFKGNRTEVREQACDKALALLMNEIIKI